MNRDAKKREEHAAAAWLLLVSAAINRQLLTYEIVGRHLGLPAFALAQVLGHIMEYCVRHGLPPLTVLVVNKETGKPGIGLSASSDHDLDRELVYSHAWLEVSPPSPSMLREAVGRAERP